MFRQTILAIAVITGVACSARSAETVKPTCAVMTFEARGGVTREEAVILTERFTAMLARTGAYRLISIDKRKEVIDAQQWAQSGNASASDLVIEAGKLLGAQYMVYGSVARLGGSYVVNAAAVNVETLATERTASAEFSGEIDDLLKYGMAVLAGKLVGPMLPDAGDSQPSAREPGVNATPPAAAPGSPAVVATNTADAGATNTGR
jgi:TolB-like protein